MRKNRTTILVLIAIFIVCTIVLSACDEPQTAIATFDGGDGAYGTQPLSITVDEGSEITLPQNLYTKQGYTFVGWDDGKGVYGAGETYVLNESTTFFAKWQKDPVPPTLYTITYLGGDDCSGDAPQEGAKLVGDTFVLKANTFERNGFNFVGWSDGISFYLVGATYIVGEQDVILTAVWQEIDVTVPTYTISYVSDNNAVGELPSEDDKQEGDTFEIAQNSQTYDGYTFEGWSDGEKVYQAGEIYTVSNKNVTLSAVWNEIERYTIAYVGGVGSVGSAPIESDKCEGDTFEIAQNSFVKARHIFIGWSDGTNVYSEGDTYTVANSDVVLTAVWQEITYSITYIGGEGATGTPPTESAKAEDSTFNLASNPFTKDNHTFEGWSDGENIYAEGDVYRVGNKNVVLTAVWKEITYTVTYVGGDGAVGDAPMLDPKVTGATFVVAENKFVKDRYDFVCWTDGVNNYNAGDTYTVGTSNVTLTAVWREITYTITYVGGDDAIGITPTESDKAEDETFELASNPFEKYKYRFVGWYDGVKTYQEGEVYTVADKNVVLVAQWEKITYTITYVGGEGVVGVPPTVEPLSQDETFVVAENQFHKYEHNFVCWTDGVKNYDAGDTYTVGTSNVTLTAVWEEITYTIAYKGGVGASGDAPIESEKVAGETFKIANNTFVREKYQFMGWHDGVKTYQAGETYTVDYKDVIFTAQWKKITYTVTYIGGDGAMGDIPTESDKSEGDSFMLAINTLSMDKHKFVGWSDGNDVYQPGDVYIVKNGNVTLTAMWEEITYTITYVGGEGAVGTAPAESDKVEGETFVVAENTFSKDKHNFVGWSDSVDNYNAGDTYTVGTSNVTLTAIWEEITYTVAYVGGEGTTGIAPAESEKIEGATFELADNSFAKVGYRFVCWTDGKDNYDVGDTYTVGTKNVQLIAVWEEILYCTLTFDANGADGTMEDVVVEMGDTVQYPQSTFEMSGCNFLGWQIGTATTLYSEGDNLLVDDNYTLRPVFGKTYTGDMGELTLWQNNNIACVDDEQCTYTQFDDIVSINRGEELCFECKLADGAYLLKDGMQSYTFTSTNGTLLSFDGYGGATLGDVDATYAKSTATAFTLVVGENEYNLTIENDGVDSIVNATIEGLVFGKGDKVTLSATFVLGDGVSGTVPNAIINQCYLEEGITFTLPSGEGLEKEGYSFVGWTKQGASDVILTGEQTITEDTIYQSAWAKNEVDNASYWDVDSDGYITLKDGVSLPSEVTIPAVVNGTSVVGIKGLADSVNYSPFYDNQNSQGVTKVIFEEGITTIAENTFALSDSTLASTLATIVLPESLTTIGASAFKNLTSLSSINIPNSVSYIGKNAFSSCTGLSGTQIHLPTSLTQLGSSAFSGIENAIFIVESDLTQLQNDTGTVKTIANGTFDSTATFYIQDDLKSAMVSASIWKNYRSKFKSLSTLGE